ncbi:unnamed protein product [Laminaria digitata]
MRTVENLRQRVSLPMGGGGASGYTPVHPSDSEDPDGDGSDFEFGVVGGEEFGEGSRARGRGVGRVSAGGGGRRNGRDEDLLWPPYTPLYTNMKVLRRKRLDASMVYYRAGKCTKVCFVTSLWGMSFLSWLGYTLARGSAYILPKDSTEEKVTLSHSLFGAAAMYFVCSCLSGYSWYKSSYGTRPLPTMGDTSLQ